jgi:hypothetical protein
MMRDDDRSDENAITRCLHELHGATSGPFERDGHIGNGFCSLCTCTSSFHKDIAEKSDIIRRASRERYSQPVMRVEQEIAEALA